MDTRFFLILFLVISALGAQSLCLGAAQAEFCTVYAHGIVDGPSQVKRFQDAIATKQVACVSFPDTMPASDWGLNCCIVKVAKLFGRPLNRLQMYMGQTKDIAAVVQIIKTHMQPNHLILYGCSRGAAVYLNYMAQHNNEHVKALVLDGCPADMPAASKLTLARLGINPDHSSSIFRRIFPSYPTDAVTPHDAIKSIKNKKLPILLIQSQTDTTVPFVHSLKLFGEFKKQGFENVYVAKISHGRHSYLLQDQTVKAAYLTAVHNFYKMHGLPYDAQWTTQNYEFFSPSNQEIDQALLAHEKFIQEVYQKALTRNTIASISVVGVALAAFALQETWLH